MRAHNIAKLLDVNARSGWYNSFPAKCGINIVWIAHLDAMGKHVEYTENHEDNVKLIYISSRCHILIFDVNKKPLTLTKWAS